MDIKEKFDGLVKEKEDLEKDVVKLDTMISSAKSTIEDIKNEWKEKWDIENLEQAKEKVQGLEEEINTIMEECEKFLKEAGEEDAEV